MTADYFLRIGVLCLACFFLVNAALGIVVWAISPSIVRKAQRMTPRAAERLLFAVRILPSAAAGFAVAALCIPSYLWLEPASSRERVGMLCLLAALAGCAAWALSARRVVRAVAWSRRCGGGAKERMTEARLHTDADVIESEGPLLALAGVLRPRIVISRGLLASLSDEQLDIALRHEKAHRRSRDNWKRLLLLGPGLAPLTRAFDALESAWTTHAEWAADDEAVAGDAQKAVTLAETLLRVARLGTPPRISPLLAPLVRRDERLAARVERLLEPRPAGPTCASPSRDRTVQAVACIATLALIALAALPATLSAVHQILEHLVR